MSNKRPNALTIAGFDPSGGAGLLADIKTLEAHRVNGCGICTAITFQHDRSFEDVSWIAQGNIEQQIRVLADRYQFSWAKIGLIQDFKLLINLIDFLNEVYPGINIIWDPIIRSSTGYTFHDDLNIKDLEAFSEKVYLMTPNKKELELFAPGRDAIDIATGLSDRCAVLITSAKQDTHVTDILMQNGESESFATRYIQSKTKHGSGCVLSSSIMANLALGASLENACSDAKLYLQKFLVSTDNLIGEHVLN